MNSQPPSKISDKSHSTSGQDRDKDLWIQLYDQLLWAAASNRLRPVVFQNHVEAHERFLAYFGISTDAVIPPNDDDDNEPLSLQDKLRNWDAEHKSQEDFKDRRERLMTGMRWRLQEKMTPRLQKGDHPELRGVTIEPWMLDQYKKIWYAIGVGKDASYPEDYPELWSFLMGIISNLFRHAPCSRFKFDQSRRVRVQCTAELDSGERCGRTDIKTVSEVLESGSWRTCDLHLGKAIPTSPDHVLIVAAIDALGERQ